MGRDAAGRPRRVQLFGHSVVVVVLRGGGSAYPDWTAQVEKAPGPSFKRTQTSFRPSLMINEEFRGWRFHARLGGGRRGEGTTAYQAWRMRRVNAGGGSGVREDLSKTALRWGDDRLPVPTSKLSTAANVDVS